MKRKLLSTYDEYYRADPATCGAPFVEFADLCGELEAGTVLDLGCGQGRDALMFARAGHRVVGVDVSQVGVRQMRAVAKAEGLDVKGVVADLTTYRPTRRFDVVILDRVLHMLPEKTRRAVLRRAMAAVASGGSLLVAEGPKGMAPLRAALQGSGWSLVKTKPNRLIALRPRVTSRAHEGRLPE